jgi:hypothetical protein
LYALHNSDNMNPGHSLDTNTASAAATLSPGSQIITRWAGPPVPERLTIDNGRRVAAVWRDFVASCPHFDPSKECFAVIGVNARLHFVGWHLVGIGSAYDCDVSPAAAFRSLLAMHADGFIAVHNHPSGVLLPSRPDERITLTLGNLAGMLGIRFHDHVIVDSEGTDSFSFREQSTVDAFSGFGISKRPEPEPPAGKIVHIDSGVTVRVSIPRAFLRTMGGPKGVQNDLFNLISDHERLADMKKPRNIRAFLRDLKRAESYKLRCSYDLILPARGWLTVKDLANLFKTSPEALLTGLCARFCRENKTLQGASH